MRLYQISLNGRHFDTLYARDWNRAREIAAKRAAPLGIHDLQVRELCPYSFANKREQSI